MEENAGPILLMCYDDHILVIQSVGGGSACKTDFWVTKCNRYVTTMYESVGGAV